MPSIEDFYPPNQPKRLASMLRRLDENSQFVTESGCRIWLGEMDDSGYGKICCGGHYRRASRIAWMAWRGPIPPGICVLHRCDVRPCINPDHLFLGTPRDNTNDMMRKRRHASHRRAA